jgi:outer membrane autotransporter protein
MDWNVGSAAQAQAILSDLSPDSWASLAAFDTGAGFRSQIERHLTDQRGEGAVDDPAVGAWAQGYGLSQKLDSNKGIAGLSGSTTGLSAGWDAQVDNVVVGVAAGYSLSNLGGHNDHFQGHLTGYQIGAYGTATWGPWYVDGSLWGNFSNGNVTRHLPSIGRTATASVSSSGFRVDAEGGYRFETDEGYGITPYLAIGYRDTAYGNITEQGLGGLGVRLSNVSGSFFTPTLGVTADGKWTLSDMITIKPLVGIALEFEGNPDDVSAQFLGGGDPFIIKSAVSNSVAFKPEAGLNVLVGRDTSFQIGYQGTIGSGYDSNGGWVGLRINW